MLHVDLDAFFVAVERVRRPELIDRPVIIGGRPGGRGMVAAASREARRCGVRVGMPLAEASIRCDDWIFLDGSFDAYFSASLQIDEVVRRESADVEWQSIDEIYVGLPDAAAPAIAAAERIRDGIRALGFDAALGVARSKLVARIASQLTRPRGVVHVLDGYEARFLSPLKIDVLPDLDPALARRFRAAGIRRLGQIAKLSEPHLMRLAGRSGLALARRAAGIDPSRIRRTALPPARIDDRDLPSPSADPEAIRAAIRAEVDRLGRELRSRGVFARTLTLRLRYADGRADSRTTSLPQPSALDDALFAAAVDLLARLPVGDRLVRGVAVSCAGLLAGAGDAALFATA